MAFGSMSGDLFESSSNRSPEPAVLFYATDDERAGGQVEQLIRRAGFEPVKVGGVEQSGRLEVGANSRSGPRAALSPLSPVELMRVRNGVAPPRGVAKWIRRASCLSSAGGARRGQADRRRPLCRACRYSARGHVDRLAFRRPPLDTSFGRWESSQVIATGCREPNAANTKGAVMSEENKALVRRIVDEAWNRGKLEVIDETFASDYQEHNPRPGQEPGIEGYKSGVLMMRAAFPDLFLDVHDVIAEDDRIALLYTLRGTHDGELMGDTGVGPASIKRRDGVGPIRT
jgi:predicted ester cyclase